MSSRVESSVWLSRPVEGNRGMWNLKKTWVWGVAVLVVVLALIVAFSEKHNQKHAGQAEGNKVLLVVTEPVANSTIANTLTIAGEFLPWQEVELHSKVAGYIQKISVDIGDKVRAGQTLAVLEVPELDAQVEGTSAAVRHSTDEIQRARNELSRAEANYASLHAAWQRLSQASAERPGLIAQQELDDAEARDKAAAAQTDAARAALSAAQQMHQESEAVHRQATAMKTFSRIVSPFDGVVTWRYADTGSLIQAGTSNVSSQPVVKVADVHVMRLRLPVPESAAASVHMGDTANVTVQATGQSFTATVTRFTGELDRSTRTMQVEIDVPNLRQEYKPGMFAEVRLGVHSHPNTLTVPVTALFNRNTDGTATILVVSTKNTVESRTVATGVEDAEHVEILQGLKLGESVIAANPTSYHDGQTVQSQASHAAIRTPGEGDR